MKGGHQAGTPAAQAYAQPGRQQIDRWMQAVGRGLILDEDDIGLCARDCGADR